MPTPRVIALILYSLSLLSGLVYGAVYLMRDRLYAVPQAALGRTWERRLHTFTPRSDIH